MLEGILPQINTPVTLLGMVLVLFLLYLISSTSGPGKEPPGPRHLPLLGNLLTLDLKRLQVSLCEGTLVIPLLTSVLQDEEEWETPHSFNPGHFLDEKGCFIKRDTFLPFSVGVSISLSLSCRSCDYFFLARRRSCPGESLARMELFFFFTILLQRFLFTPPSGVSKDELDLTPAMGLTLSPSPHRLCAVSRA